MGRLECPGENTIVAFAEGTLAADVMARVESHAASCALCQDLLGLALAAGLRGRAVEGTSAGAESALARGTSLGRYTILALAGRGGMGDVYAAYDPELDRKVALKLLRAGSVGGARGGDTGLLREAKAMAKVAHPNVVSVHDAGVVGAMVFVAMDYVDGSTMRDWLAERSRRRDEVVAMFIKAAHGLMAAHAAGLVHRDFKPGNVMIARDGSVRVTDFGLARTLGDVGGKGERDALPAGGWDLGATLTAPGRLLGTPRYMAPEQFKDEPPDARTDQFGFCVALYEALYGVQPFGDGRSLSALTAAVLAGRVEPAPPKSNVPAWLRGVVLRGLSLNPGDRWPSMRELVAALAQDPARTRRRWVLAIGVSLLVALPVIFLAREPGQSASLCRGGPARLAGVWEPLGSGGQGHPRRDVIERAFLASGAPDARDVWTRVAALLDRYRAGWLAMYEDACFASHVRGAQSPSVLDARMSCLDERRTALVALTDVFAGADRGVVGKGVDAVNALPDLQRCGDIEALRTPVEPPRDEATRLRVADFRRRLANAKAMNDTGKHREARPIVLSVIADARALGYRPALTEALAHLAGTVVGAVETHDIVALTDEALWTTIGAGSDDLAASAAVGRLAASYYFSPNLAECRYWGKLARALVERAGAQQKRLGAWLLHDECNIELRSNNLLKALELVRDSAAIKERVLPPGHPDIALAWSDEAAILHALGRNEEALRTNRRAYDTFAAAYGPASLEASYSTSNRGEYLMDLGRPIEAVTAFRSGLAGWEAQAGPENPNLGYPLTGMGRALFALGRAREAVPPLERALRLREPSHTDPSLVAETQFALAQALAGEDASHARAVSLATKARATYLQLANQTRAAAVDAWLAAQHKTRRAR